MGAGAGGVACCGGCVVGTAVDGGPCDTTGGAVGAGAAGGGAVFGPACKGGGAAGAGGAAFGPARSIGFAGRGFAPGTTGGRFTGWFGTAISRFLQTGQ